MSSPGLPLIPASSDKLRVAVEGCGHGTLHAIYASIAESCAAKGWDGVDLVIIGGDFQACRNAFDLNVTAMPHKYRRMADFHEYYSGKRKAPYLTIFVGGNHEASNHLFELYYGGWVAPNIYYLGAANVLHCGPIRIATLSGIWKGYDYRKPHFERLPYNNEDMTTIFHTRELDARKLLCLRSQVDVGLSHDWPEGVVWHGDHRKLFKWKDRFEEDAKSGKLGNVAAKQVLERLRPRWWFSAHLHCKYTAVVNHQPEQKEQHALDKETADKKPAARIEDREQISAWQSFHRAIGRNDVDNQNQEQESKSATKDGNNYTYQEVFKKVATDEDLHRSVESTEVSEWKANGGPPQTSQPVGNSIIADRKRRREVTDSPTEQPAPSADQEVNPATGLEPKPTKDVIANPDAIDIDMSDDDDEPTLSTAQHSLDYRATELSSTTKNVPLPMPNSRADQQFSKNVDKSAMTEGSVLLQPPRGSPATQSTLGQEPVPSDETRGENDIATDLKSSLNPTATKSHRVSQSPEHGIEDTAPATHGNNIEAKQEDADLKSGPSATNLTTQPTTIPDDLRAELAALSSNFVDPTTTTPSPSMSFPEAITNRTTHFLALDKCEPHRDFLQLLELSSITSTKPITRPVKLAYDPIWLSILRVFASELELGGKPTDKIRPHRGETYYNDRILEEEKWIKEHVVEKDLLTIPENFELTAPIYDPNVVLQSKDMPREYPNPQTKQFCDLIGIENKFDISDEEVAARIAEGPRPESEWVQRGSGRGGYRGGRGGSGNRGGRGGGYGREGRAGRRRGSRGGRGSW